MTGSREDGAQDARAALARLLQLAPHVFPAVAVTKDWTAALDQARQVVKPRKKGMGQ